MKKNILLPLLAAFQLTLSASASAAACYHYDTVINSTVTGPYTEVRNSIRQVAVVRDQGFRSNPLELLIRFPGDLNNFGTQPGTIELMTNTAFARNPGISAAAFDLGTFTGGADGSFIFQLDPGLALQQPPPNVFVTQGVSGNPGGLGGICFVPGLQGLCQQTQGAPVLSVFYLIPGQGTVAFGFLDQASRIQGQFDIIGFGFDNPNLQARYQGQFSGAFVGSTAC